MTVTSSQSRVRVASAFRTEFVATMPHGGAEPVPALAPWPSWIQRRIVVVGALRPRLDPMNRILTVF